MLEREFLLEDIKKIKQIPLSERYPCDTRYWSLTSNGVYTTKSGYWLGRLGYVQRWRNRNDQSEDQVWNTIWCIDGPPKLKLFAWRATNDALAVSWNLSRRNVVADPQCPICHDHNEDAIHALFDCSWTAQAWGHSQFIGTLLEAPTASLRDRLMWCAEKLNKEDFTRFVTIAWACWKARNDFIFQNITPAVSALVAGFMRLVDEFRAYAIKVLTCPTRSAVQSNNDWRPPPAGVLKINTDAGFLEDGWVGLGVVIRNSSGRACAMAVRRWKADITAEFAEALAGRWGMLLAFKLGFTKVMLECDALGLIQRIQHPEVNFSPLGLVIEDILVSGSKFLFFESSHVRRVGNTVAHYLARLTPSNGVEELFVDNFPQGLISLLELDLDIAN